MAPAEKACASLSNSLVTSELSSPAVDTYKKMRVRTLNWFSYMSMFQSQFFLQFLTKFTTVKKGKGQKKKKKTLVNILTWTISKISDMLSSQFSASETEPDLPSRTLEDISKHHMFNDWKDYTTFQVHRSRLCISLLGTEAVTICHTEIYLPSIDARNHYS